MKIDKEDIRCTSDPNHGLDELINQLAEKLNVKQSWKGKLRI